MSARRRNSHPRHCNTTSTEFSRRRLPFPLQAGKSQLLQIRPVTSVESRRRGSRVRDKEMCKDSCRPRRPFSAIDHTTIPACTSCSRYKRSLGFREPGLERVAKKRKPFSGSSSGKSKGSKEMVSHKYRTVDSVQRSGVSNGSSQDKPKDLESTEGIIRRSRRTNKEEASTANGVPSSCSTKKGNLCSHEGTPEDWTEEHLDEPRKTDKRKSLDELETREGAGLVSWTKKARRRLRKGEKNAIAATENERTHEAFDCGAAPEEEVERSLSSSEAVKENVEDMIDYALRNEQVGLIKASGVQELPLTSNCCEPNLASVEDSSGGYLLETSVPCSSIAMEITKDADALGLGETAAQGFTAVKLLENEPHVRDSFHDHAGAFEGNEQSNAPVDIREGDAVPIPLEDPKTLLMHDSIAKNKDVVTRAHECELRFDLAEGRICGLCGGDGRGEPPGYLLPVSSKRNSHQNTCSDPNYPGYSEWDTFGKEPGWLGTLLGPLDDHFSISGVWVHQECAIWSPEVYFAGVGRIKNIKAALRRGKLLKCTRCSRPGATIGCRIERCPRTYHLPCARYEGCYFDHKRFLMACDEHLHLFLPCLPGHRHRRRSLNLGRIRLKRKIGEWRKMAQRAAQLDVEAEEKWQEKVGVDEEFLRRERKRFQRDMARLAPLMVGGGDGQPAMEGWESIAGSENVVQCMKEMVILPLLYPEAFSSLSVSPPRGVLLHGHPGTGKTLAVKALVGACAKGHQKIAYFARKGADCLGKYAGDAERQLRMLFYLAEKHQPSIIFFDEIDGLAPTRSQHQDQTQKSVVSTLLALMDGIKPRGSVVVIGATNRPDSLDPALRRPGRFDREIYFPLPSFEGRTAILRLLMKDWQISQKDDIISLLASRTVGFAGADLQALCAQAALNSLKRSLPLGGLMDCAEQGMNKMLDSPDLMVNSVDLAAALAQVSPPCSSRSAKAAVRIIGCAPVPCHLLPALLWPMVNLLVSLFLEDRVTLPPTLEQVARSLAEMLEGHLGGSWTAQVKSFLHETMNTTSKKRLGKDVEEVFSLASMVSYQKVIIRPSYVHHTTYKGSKLRLIVSGAEKFWLDSFMAWLLFGFEGYVEMCNLNLMTMLQEGGGDAVQGLIHILWNVRNKSACVIYMPQMDSWAVEPFSEEEEQRQASYYWSIFLQQVNLLPASLHVSFMASSEMQKGDFPPEIAEFFMGTAVNPQHNDIKKPSSSQKAWLFFHGYFPCAWVEASYALDMDTIFSRAAENYAELIQERFLHFKESAKRSEEMGLLESGHGDIIVDKQDRPLKVRPSEGGRVVGRVDVENLTGAPMQHAYVAADTEKCSKHTTNQGEGSPAAYIQEQCSPLDTHDIGTTSRSGMKPTDLHTQERTQLAVAISMVGYHLLHHPELRELHHATSKLQGGPSFTARARVRKVLSSDSADSSTSQGNHCESLDVSGLKAVGLLAYTGSYQRARDVALGVREVLELLMQRIDAKVSRGKDRVHFSDLLHQAASLEDKVLTWAYNMCKYEVFQCIPGQSLRDDSPPKGVAVEAPAYVAETDAGKDSEAVHLAQPLSASSLTAFPDSSNARDLNIKTLWSDAQGVMQLDARNTEQSSGAKGQVEAPISSDHMKGVSAELDSMATPPSSLSCPDCLHQAKRELKKVFVRSWRSRGMDVSLQAADEVIGTCSSALSVALYGAFREGGLQCETSSSNMDCLCRDTHKQTMDKKILSSAYACLCPFLKLILDLK